MTWLQRYRVRHYLGSSIWIFPVLSTLAAIGAVRVLHWIELDTGWVSPVHPGLTHHFSLGFLGFSWKIQDIHVIVRE